MIHRLVLIAIILASCSQLEKKDCSNINWYELGKKDGAKGRRSTMFVQHSLKCSELPKSSAYKKGRKEGLLSFCTLEGGVDYGLTGALYIGQCSDFGKNAIKTFKSGLKRGLAVYRQNELISELDQKLRDVKFDLTTSFHEKDEARELEIQKQSLEKELRTEREFLNKLIKGLPPRKL